MLSLHRDTVMARKDGSDRVRGSDGVPVTSVGTGHVFKLGADRESCRVESFPGPPERIRTVSPLLR